MSETRGKNEKDQRETAIVLFDKEHLRAAREEYKELMDAYNEPVCEIIIRDLKPYHKRVRKEFSEYLKKARKMLGLPEHVVLYENPPRVSVEEIVPGRRTIITERASEGVLFFDTKEFSRGSSRFRIFPETISPADIYLNTFQNDYKTADFIATMLSRNEELADDAELQSIGEVTKTAIADTLLKLSEIKGDVFGNEAMKRLNMFTASLRVLVGEEYWHKQTPEFFRLDTRFSGYFIKNGDPDWKISKRVFYKPYEGRLVVLRDISDKSDEVFDKMRKDSDVTSRQLLDYLMSKEIKPAVFDFEAIPEEPYMDEWVDLHKRIAWDLIKALKIKNLEGVLKGDKPDLDK